MELTASEIEPEKFERLDFGKGKLYSALPIPAYQILGIAKEHTAKNVLICLASHLGKNNRKSFPSYTTIARETGHTRSTISRSLSILESMGYILIHKIYPNGRPRNIYYLQDSCWNHGEMSKDALKFSPVVGRCKCGAAVKLGEFGVGTNDLHHYRCGEVVSLLKSRKKKLYGYTNAIGK